MADESPALSASQTGSQKRPWVISDSPTRSSDSRTTRPVLESHRSSVQNILLFSSDQPAAPKLGSQALPINVEDTSPRPKKKLKAKDLDAVQNRICELEATTFPTPGPSRATSSHAAGSSRGAFVTLHANPAGRATLLITDEPLRSKINIRPRPGPIGHHDGWRRSNARGVPESQLLHSGPRPPSLTAKEPHHQCTICHCVKTHPVSYKCGHTHCFICIRVWLQISWKCPDCNQVMHGPPSRNYDVEDWLSTRVTQKFNIAFYTV
ncbi:hypothetical protein B0H14DRAFT_2636103 [Mycena olivaceomarginata]|nr:hypothetical protein B0H14DRAFT_2636103 [Mycena olivaceomarginata]